MRVRVCFVCLGNICRSPTAEGIFRHLVREAGLDESFEIDSAGTAAHHTGEPPDRRSAAAARARGIVLEGSARKFVAEDFARFDAVVAMDRANYDDLLDRMPHRRDHAKLSMLRDHDPASPAGGEVPDPYYGGPRGFEDVVDICLAACAGLLDRLRDDHGLKR